MIAAFQAARRGHEVTLWDKRARLGGALYYAGLAPCKEPFKRYLKFLLDRLKSVSVKLSLEKEGDADTILEYAPDQVLIATGSLSPSPAIPGAEKVELKSVEEGFEKSSGGSRVLVIGGGARGSELAEYLAHRGDEVTVVEAFGRLAGDTPLQIRHYVAGRLKAAGVTVRFYSMVKEFLPSGVRIQTEGGEELLAGFDPMILAFGDAANLGLYRILYDAGLLVSILGDARQPRDLMAAVHEGYRSGDSV